jgi:hypothetical protein
MQRICSRPGAANSDRPRCFVYHLACGLKALRRQLYCAGETLGATQHRFNEWTPNSMSGLKAITGVEGRSMSTRA